MKNDLVGNDVRPYELSADFRRPTSDINWIASWALAAIVVASGFAYLLWLDSGCQIQGVMTWHGKVCQNY